MRPIILLIMSHVAVGFLGVVVGVYSLPILTAPASPSESEIKVLVDQTYFTADFTKGLKGSDAFHWGEGKVSLASNYVAFMGELAPGPDYKLYLSPEFVETEAEFERLKYSMRLVGDVKTFDNFLVESASDIELFKYNTVVVWCETFGEFITSARYRE